MLFLVEGFKIELRPSSAKDIPLSVGGLHSFRINANVHHKVGARTLFSKSFPYASHANDASYLQSSFFGS